MKRPGKRNRLRKQRKRPRKSPGAADEPSSLPHKACVHLDAEGGEPASVPAAPAARRLWGPIVAVTAGLLAFLGYTLVQGSDSSIERGERAELKLVPLRALPDLPDSPPEPAETFAGSGILLKDAGGCVPPLEPTTPTNGFLSYRQALDALPTPSVQVKRQLERLARDADAKLDKETRSFVRDSARALDLLRGAATSTLFKRVGEATDHDLLAPRHLALAALARARMELRGAPAMAVRWPLFVVRLSYGLARESPFAETQVALHVARIATSWIESSLDAQRWNSAERRWLAERLAALEAARPEGVHITDAEGLPAEKQAQALQANRRLFATEGAALAALRRRVTQPDTSVEVKTVDEEGDNEG